MLVAFRGDSWYYFYLLLKRIFLKFLKSGSKGFYMFPIGVVSGLTRFSMVLHGFAWFCMVSWQRVIGHCFMWLHVVGYGCAWFRMILMFCMIACGCPWFCKVLQGFAWFGVVWLSFAWFRMVLRVFIWLHMLSHCSRSFAWFCMVLNDLCDSLDALFLQSCVVL